MGVGMYVMCVKLEARPKVFLVFALFMLNLANKIVEAFQIHIWSCSVSHMTSLNPHHSYFCLCGRWFSQIYNWFSVIIVKRGD